MFYKADVPAKDVAAGFVVPKVPRSNIGQAVALVGSLIMPHNIYLHSALVQTRQLRRQDDQHRQEALVYYGIESALSLLVSQVAQSQVAQSFGPGAGGLHAQWQRQSHHRWRQGRTQAPGQSDIACSTD